MKLFDDNNKILQFNLPKSFSKITLILITFVLLLPNSSVCAEQTSFRRHFLILYDNSFPFMELEKKTPQLKGTISALFNNKIPNHGEINKLKLEKQNNILFFDPENDQISFYFFGINENNRLNLSVRAPHLHHNQLYQEFTKKFINTNSIFM